MIIEIEKTTTFDRFAMNEQNVGVLVGEYMWLESATFFLTIKKEEC